MYILGRLEFGPNWAGLGRPAADLQAAQQLDLQVYSAE